MPNSKYPNDALFVIRVKGNPTSMSYKRVEEKLLSDPEVARFCPSDQWLYVWGRSLADLEPTIEQIKRVGGHVEVVNPSSDQLEK